MNCRPALRRRLDQFAVARLAEILHDSLGDLGSDLFGQLQIFHRRVFDGFHAAEGLGEEDGGALADEAYAEGCDDSRHGVRARAIDVADHIGGALGAHALQVDEVREFQVVEIGHVAHQAAIHQLIDESFSHAVDIHHAAGGEVKQGLLEAGGTVGIDAAAGGLALLAHDLALADGAKRRHAEGLAVRALGRRRGPLWESHRRSVPPPPRHRSAGRGVRSRPRCGAWRGRR